MSGCCIITVFVIFLGILFNSLGIAWDMGWRVWDSLFGVFGMVWEEFSVLGWGMGGMLSHI